MQLPELKAPSSPAGRAGMTVYFGLWVVITLLMAVVTLLLLFGLVIDPTSFSHQIPVILLGAVMTAGGGLYTYLGLRRLLRKG
ncbi:hypothetical protein HH310_31635 [Actinoplanes sp. TBRC 11911]|uniref:hypothetical protein n=1 Tax=Actinoplanes sp. TBRC 11911 TaxID=2729386 RepID=UPI00145D083F|nr:hypothetical protein [Actinoplanes sp. TBRC 11911]NMO55722.1 hypothetical protein [Actinoplanes sp. TBRC 11911]